MAAVVPILADAPAAILSPQGLSGDAYRGMLMGVPASLVPFPSRIVYNIYYILYIL